MVPAEYSKSRRDRYIPVPIDVEENLKKVQENKLHIRTIQRYLKDIIRKFHIDDNKTCHSFRHTFALQTLISNNVTYRMWVLGHKELKTTMKYLNFDFLSILRINLTSPHAFIY